MVKRGEENDKKGKSGGTARKILTVQGGCDKFFTEQSCRVNGLYPA
jgi:hypothetical protein